MYFQIQLFWCPDCCTLYTERKALVTYMYTRIFINSEKKTMYSVRVRGCVCCTFTKCNICMYRFFSLTCKYMLDYESIVEELIVYCPNTMYILSLFPLRILYLHPPPQDLRMLSSSLLLTNQIVLIECLFTALCHMDIWYIKTISNLNFCWSAWPFLGVGIITCWNPLRKLLNFSPSSPAYGTVYRITGGCNVSPSLTNVSPTENSWMLHPLDIVFLGFFAPDPTIPSLYSDCLIAFWI